MNLKIAVLIPDTHRPFHSRRAYDLMLNVMADLPQIDDIVLLGDYGDFYCIHGHGPKHPKIPQLIDTEIRNVNDGLDELDVIFPYAKKTYIEGNHEFRLWRFLMNNAPQLLDHISCEKLFELDKRKNWSWIPYGPEQLTRVGNSKLFARHEPLGPSPKSTAIKALCSLTYGHIHRIEETHIVGIDGTDYVCFSVGWLGDNKYKEVFGYVKNRAQWQMGFGVVYYNPFNKYFYHHKIHILNNYTCVFNGKLYK